jgi:hypothetical protein
MIYFAPEGPERYDALGLKGTAMNYFPSRAAAMGPVPADVVIATFFNFNPELVRQAIPEAWSIASPAAILDARLDAVDAALRRLLGDDIGSDQMADCAALARKAAESACAWPEGRPLFGGHAELPWPDASSPHLVLWHAQTLLREFRGDAHVAMLLTEGLTGIDALVIHAATGEVPDIALRMTRNWDDDQWAAAVERLHARGLVTAPDGPLDLTDAGREHRQRVEDRTDTLMAPAYDVIGEDGTERLGQLGRKFSRTIVDSGAFGFSGGATAAPRK